MKIYGIGKMSHVAREIRKRISRKRRASSTRYKKFDEVVEEESPISGSFESENFNTAVEDSKTKRRGGLSECELKPQIAVLRHLQFESALRDCGLM